MLNHIDIMGRLCNDPELRHTPSGVPVCTFRIANDTGRKDRDGNRITRCVTCVAWRGSAEFAAKYLAKGRLVVVEGELDVREFTDREGVKRREPEIIVGSIHFADSKRGDDQQDGAPSNYGTGGDFEELGSDDRDLPF